MTHVSAEDFREFFQLWGSSIFSYCRLSLGDGEKAERATEQIFVEYFRNAVNSADEEILSRQKLPTDLIRRAVTVVAQNDAAGSELRALSQDERAVFVMTIVLQLPLGRVAQALSISEEDVQRLWMAALLRFRTSCDNDDGLFPVSFAQRLTGAES